MPILKIARPLDNPERSVQGYRDEFALQGDIADIKRLKEEGNDDVTKTRIGKACHAALDYFGQRLEQICDNPNHIKFANPPLKKAGRIYDKALNYAVELDADRLRIENVRDILRASISYDPSYLQENASSVVDRVDRAFKGNLVQVKNRFITRNFPVVPSQKAHFSENDVVHLYEHGLRGRDLLYRDLQFLVLIKQDVFPNIAPFNHIYGEIQITYNQMLEKKHDGGHAAYKLVRRVMEYCEYKHLVAKNPNLSFNPARANQHFEGTLQPDDFANFANAFTSSLGHYRKGILAKEPPVPLAEAIDRSKWYRSFNP